MNQFDSSKILKTIPSKPGVYKFIDSKGDIIYVGKAKDLKKRVKSYFQRGKDQTTKTKVLVDRIADLEYIVVDTELEAIMLETNLIKELRPKYNVLMKDDKNFVYIKITTQDDYPKIYLTRRMERDGSTYFGPKTSGFDIRKTVKMLSTFLPFKTCQFNIEWIKTDKETTNQQKKAPCIFYEIDKGHSPCISQLSSYEYRKLINKVIDFFKGKHNELLQSLKEQMIKAAETREFETAANLRDSIQTIEAVIERQKISAPTDEEMDVIDIIFEQNKYFVNLFQVREGKLIAQENFILSNSSNEMTDGEIFTTFIEQYYDQAGSIPKTILIAEKPENHETLEIWLTNLRGSKVHINIPKIGRKNNLIELANKNAQSYAKQMRVKWMAEEKKDPSQVLPNLKEILKLKKEPQRIECYDISHLGGTNTIGSMVVFENGEPKKDHYRHFNIKMLESGEINDFDSLNEVLFRRLKYLAKLEKNLSLKKKGESYSLTKGKTVLASVTAKSNDKFTTHLTDLKCEKSENLSKFLTTLTQKLTTKKILLHNSNPDFNEQLKELGFVEIENQDYNFGFYKQKQIKDDSFSSIPDLIVIDGGKGQLSSAIKARNKLGVKIPMISLAKKHEEIFLEDKTKIILPIGSGELSLIQRLRDEAHRFAITLNRKARIKKMTD